MAVPLVWLAVFLSGASADFLKHQPVVIGQTFMAGSTDPTQGSTAWALTSHGIAEKLFTVDKEGNIVGQVAESVRKLDKFSWEVTLKAGYSFSDGTQVTAARVADALTRLNSVNSGAQASLGTMTMTALDTLKLKIESERATPVMDAVLAEWPFAVYLVKNGQFFFTGPFAVETFVQGERIELIPNPHYALAVERPLLIIKKYPDGDSLATALKAGELDMAFHLPVDVLPELRQQDGVYVKSFLVGYHYMMWHNTRAAPLSDLRVRKAVDMALDRQELTQELRGGQATRSFFPGSTPYALQESLPTADKSGAEDLLDQAGWIKNASGSRVKDGSPLTLHLVAYPQRPGLAIMQPVIKRTLTALGITVRTTLTSGSSWDELDQIMAHKSFDLLLWAQNTLPAGDPQWFLNAFFRTDAGNNHAGLSSSEVDDLLDNLAHTQTHGERVSATAAAHKAILEEVPVSNLMTPAWHVGLSSRLSTYEPWGSDYYVVHSSLRIKPNTDSGTQSTEETEGTGNANGAIRVTLGVLSLAGVSLFASLF